MQLNAMPKTYNFQRLFLAKKSRSGFIVQYYRLRSLSRDHKLKICCPQGRAGTSPARGTNYINDLYDSWALYAQPKISGVATV